MSKTYIFGHKRPDSDAIMSAIGLSYLKNQLGEETEARILGDPNKETKYALEYFKLDTPEYLNDVKLQVRDVAYGKGKMIDEKNSIYNAYQFMLKEELTGVPVVNAERELVGLVTLKDLSRIIISENIEVLNTSFDNLLEVLNAESLNKVDNEVLGKILVAAYDKDTFKDKVTLDKDTVLIVGDRHDLVEYALNSNIKMLIISGNSDIKDSNLELAKKNNISVIRTSYDSYHIAKLIGLSNYIKSMIRNYAPVKFDETDFISSVKEVNEKNGHTNYPVVDKNNKCLGLLKMKDISKKDPKKVILVDHNEPLQSVEGIEEAQIMEIFDHHALSSLTTAQPINYRNMAVGSTCTIVYTMFKERGIEIPKEIAGALLSGVLSDTLILKSPTATPVDEAAVKELAKLAEVDYEEYGMAMIKAGTSVEGMTKDQILYNDFKLFTAGDKKFGVGQFFTMDFDEMKKEMDEYVAVLDKEAEQNNTPLMCLYITDIIQNGSYVIYNTKGEEYMKLAYSDRKVEEGFFVENCVSRKKNVVPVIMPVFE